MIRVCVVDDQTLVRQGIRNLLELSDDVTVVAEAADGDEALAQVERDPPDVVLLDLRMPGRDGIATLESLRIATSTCRRWSSRPSTTTSWSCARCAPARAAISSRT